MAFPGSQRVIIEIDSDQEKLIGTIAMEEVHRETDIEKCRYPVEPSTYSVKMQCFIFAVFLYY